MDINWRKHMIKKLKTKIILFIMIVIGCITILFASGISIYYSSEINKEANMALDSTFMPFDGEINKNEHPFVKINATVIEYNKTNKEISIQTNDLELDDDTINNYLTKVNDLKQKDGKLKKEKIIFKCQDTKDKTLYAFANYTYFEKKIIRVYVLTFSIALVFLFIIFIMSLIVANNAIKPVKESIERQKKFIADASHELKTPLSVILANNKILQSISSSEQEEWLNSNQEEIVHMKDIINDMLSLATIDSCNLVLANNINLSKIITSICLQFEAVAYEKNIKLVTKIEENVLINYNERMLKQLVMILIDNAIKYETTNGEVNVTLEKSIFKVNNKNTIIANSDLTHIFDRFYKVDQSRSSEGVGLGLAIAKEIVDKHSGQIMVTSNKNQGTTFTVDFKQSIID